MIVGAPMETFPGERRVAITPAVLSTFTRAGIDVLIEAGAGDEAGFPDATYTVKGAHTAGSRDEIFERADVVLQVRGFSANPEAGKSDLARIRKGQTIIALLDPLNNPQGIRALAERHADVFAMEMIPRISRAQRMDVLSAMATLAGYRAVLMAAQALPKLFPMLMTAAGTVSPAKVFVVGAGVAGLQAIATARRLGAVVHAYDVRPEVKEQVQSLGAQFVEMSLEAEDARDEQGYAKAQSSSFYERQRELMAQTVAESDVVITTAQVPGKEAPKLITAEMVDGMAPGSVIIDLAAEQGGNCALTKADQRVKARGVTIIGPINLPASVPHHGSLLYSRNLATFFFHLFKDGELKLDLEDEIIRQTLVARGGEVIHPRILELLA